MKNLTFKVALAVIVLVMALVIYRNYTAVPPAAIVLPSASASYSCSEGKTIAADFFAGVATPATTTGQPPIPGGSVKLTLSDGRSLDLPQTLSADGSRYANADESFVFWSRGNGALVLENNQQKSFTGCITVAKDPGGLPQSYSNGSEGFSIRLPAGYAIDEKYSYQNLGPGKEIGGTRFTIPPAMATGTNLSADSYVSVEEIPDAKSCLASQFLMKGAKAATTTENDMTYSVATTSDAAAGNRYEETVYAFPDTNPCLAVRYFIHYGAIGNYPEGAVKEFDKAALLAQFDQIRRTLTLVQ